jgi:hypothetical protein
MRESASPLAIHRWTCGGESPKAIRAGHDVKSAGLSEVVDLGDGRVYRENSEKKLSVLKSLGLGGFLSRSHLWTLRSSLLP